MGLLGSPRRLTTQRTVSPGLRFLHTDSKAALADKPPVALFLEAQVDVVNLGAGGTEGLLKFYPPSATIRLLSSPRRLTTQRTVSPGLR